MSGCNAPPNDLARSATRPAIVDLAPAEGTAAFVQGDLHGVCGRGASLRRNPEFRNVLLTCAEKKALGIPIIDVIAITAAFVPVLAMDTGLDAAAMTGELACCLW